MTIDTHQRHLNTVELRQIRERVVAGLEVERGIVVRILEKLEHVTDQLHDARTRLAYQHETVHEMLRASLPTPVLSDLHDAEDDAAWPKCPSCDRSLAP